MARACAWPALRPPPGRWPTDTLQPSFAHLCLNGPETSWSLLPKLGRLREDPGRRDAEAFGDGLDPARPSAESEEAPASCAVQECARPRRAPPAPLKR